MKRKIRLTIGLILGLAIVTLMHSDSRVDAQGQVRIVGDTGVITLGPGQHLRLSVSGAGAFAFRSMKYEQTTCSDGVCKFAVESQTTTNPTPTTSGEALFYEYIEIDGVRVLVLSNSRDAHVTAMIIDTATGKVVSVVQKTDAATPLI